MFSRWAWNDYKLLLHMRETVLFGEDVLYSPVLFLCGIWAVYRLLLMKVSVWNFEDNCYFGIVA